MLLYCTERRSYERRRKKKSAGSKGPPRLFCNNGVKDKKIRELVGTEEVAARREGAGCVE